MHAVSRPGTVSLSANALGTALSKHLIVLEKCGGNMVARQELADQFCRNVPSLGANYRTKAGVGAATTSGTGWAAEVAPYEASTEFFQLLQSASIFGRLLPQFRRIPFRVKVAREVSAGAGAAWHQEALPRPITSEVLATLQSEYNEADCIVVVSRELLTFGIVAEQALRAAVIAGAARFIDNQLLTSTVTASALHPGSILAGAYTVSSTGTSGAQVSADLENMLAKIEGGGDGLTWIMKRTTYARICAALASIGCPVERGFLLSLPVVVGSTSPAQVALVDVNNVATSYDETAIALDVTSQADVEMFSGSSSQSGATGVGVQMVSLYQSNLAAIKASLPVTWQTIQFAPGSPSVPLAAVVMPVSY